MDEGSTRKIVRLHIEIRDGHRCEVDEFGVVRRTSDPREADRAEQRSQGFQINLRRRMAVEKLIQHRSPEANAQWLKGYATVAASAMTMTRLLKGRARSDKPALEWIAKWCLGLPLTDAQKIVAQVSRFPRGMTSIRAGRLLGATAAEIEATGIQTIAPADMSEADIIAAKKARKRKMDRERIRMSRRAKGAQPKADTQSSVSGFCRLHGIARYSYQKAASRGLDSLLAFLAKKGVSAAPPEKLAGASVSKRSIFDTNRATVLPTLPVSRRDQWRQEQAATLLDRAALGLATSPRRTSLRATP